MDRIVSNIKKYLEKNSISARSAEIAIGVGNGTLSKPLSKGTSIKTDTLEKFLNTYEDFQLSSNYIDDFDKKDSLILENSQVNEKENNYEVEPKEIIQKINLLKELFGIDGSKLTKVISNQEKILELLERQVLQDNIKRIKEDIMKDIAKENKQ